MTEKYLGYYKFYDNLLQTRDSLYECHMVPNELKNEATKFGSLVANVQVPHKMLHQFVRDLK